MIPVAQLVRKLSKITICLSLLDPSPVMRSHSSPSKTAMPQVASVNTINSTGMKLVHTHAGKGEDHNVSAAVWMGDGPYQLRIARLLETTILQDTSTVEQILPAECLLGNEASMTHVWMGSRLPV